MSVLPQMTAAAESDDRAEADALSDRALMAACAKAEPGAMEQLVARYQRQVARLAERLLGWPEDVDDVVQEVFLRVLEQARRFRGESQVGTWITAITLNRCRTLRRRMQLRLRNMRRMREEPAAAAEPADAGAQVIEQRLRVRLAVSRLARRDREVIVLHYLEEQPIDELVAALGISRNAVEVRLHRARKKLQVLLSVDES
jgi:RNA polymerase sigma-70 factor (ECF subfamily)